MSRKSDVSDPDLAPEIDDVDEDVSEMSIEADDNSDEIAEILELPAEIVSLCSLSPTLVVAGCMDDNAYLCCVDQEIKIQVVATLSGHSDSVVDIAKNPKYAVFATSSYDGTIRLYSVESLLKISALDGPSSEIEFIQFDSSGEHLMAGCADGSVWIWQLAFSAQDAFEVVTQSVLTGHTEGVTNGLFFDNQKAVTVSLDGCVIVWDLNSSRSIHRIRAPGQSPLVSMTYGRQPGTIMVGCASGVLLAASVESGKILNQVQACENSIESISFNSSGSFLACGSTDGTLSIRETSRLFASAPRHKIHVGAGISALKWHETENLVFVCTVAGEFAVFCPLTGSPVLRLQGGTEALLSMSLGKLPNGQCAVFTGGDDATLRMFALQLEDEEAADDLSNPAVP